MISVRALEAVAENDQEPDRARFSADRARTSTVK